MKALIRNPDETVTEADGIEGIDWNTGTPLTNEAWCGGPYVLVTNYVAPKSPEEDAVYEVVDVAPGQDAMPAPENPTPEEPIVINGVAYTKEQLRQMLGE